MPQTLPHPPESRPSRLVVFFGLSGSGKSYLGRRWAARHHYAYHNSDEVRKELSGLSPESRHHVPFNEGLYSPEKSRRTYAALLQRAGRDLDDQALAGVVLDASYTDGAERQKVVDCFSGRTVISFIRCYCSTALTRERFTLRGRDDQAVSDGRWEIYCRQKERFAIPGQIDGARLLNLDTGACVERLIERVDAFVLTEPGRSSGEARCW
jgi:predicted kinase